jgi:hypothetical protein
LNGYADSIGSLSKSSSPKKITPEIIIDKTEATVNVEDVPSSGTEEEKKPDDDADMTGEYRFILVTSTPHLPSPQRRL